MIRDNLFAINKEYVVKPALCLDFDFTIRYPKKGRFINHPDDIILFNGVEKTIWEYKNNGFYICGITNQGGVAFGFKTPEANMDEIQRTLDLFENNPFDLVQYAYGHDKGSIHPFNHRSLLRKPDYGMLVLCEATAFENGVVIDWDKSIFVGDRSEDKEVASRAGLKFIWANEFFEHVD